MVSNAGGINPHDCAKALHDAALKSGVTFNVAVVTGDDLMAQVGVFMTACREVMDIACKDDFRYSMQR